MAFALRTLVGPWMVVPAAVLEIANFFQRGMPWRGEGMWTVEWFAISLFVIGPLAAGAAAVDAARLSRPGNIHLVVSTPRPVLPYVRAVAWCAGPLAGLHLTAIVAGIIAGPVTSPSVGWTAMAAAAVIQCLAIGWYAAVGSVVGRFLSPLAAGLAGATAGLVLFYILSDASLGGPDRFSLLDLGGATITLLGLAYDTGYLLGQAVILAVTAAMFVHVGVRTTSAQRTPTVVGAGVLFLAIATIVAGTQLLPTTRMVADPEPPRHCVGSQPVICLHHEHRRFHEVVDDHIRALSNGARDAGYQALALERVSESSRTFRAGGGPSVVALWLPADVYEKGIVHTQDLVVSLLTPRHCEQLRAATAPGEEYWWRHAALTFTWLQLADVPVDRVMFETGYRPMETLEPQEVEDIIDDFKRCELEGAG